MMQGGAEEEREEEEEEEATELPCARCGKEMQVKRAKDADRQSISRSHLHRIIVDSGMEVDVAGTLFDFSTAMTRVQHPLCYSCLDALEVKLSGELQEAERELISFKASVQGVARPPVDPEQYRRELVELQETGTQLQREIGELERELHALQGEDAALALEEEELRKAEEEYWEEVNESEESAQATHQELKALEHQQEDAMHKTHCLNTLQVQNDVFFISVQEHIGTINGLRLGTLPSCRVDFSEINAALGHVCLMVEVLGRKLEQARGFTFSKYIPVPQGSSSYMQLLDGSASYPLVGSSGMFHNSFDKAMVALLSCVRDLGSCLEEEDPQLAPPKRMTDVALEQYNIVLRNSDQEGWTMALRFLLLNLKSIMKCFFTRIEPELRKARSGL